MNDTALLPGIKLAAPQISIEEIERVVAVLAKGQLRPGKDNAPPTLDFWMTAEEIAAAIGASLSFERRVRKIASAAAPRIVSFPGSPGYKLWENCLNEEINHCIDSIQSQADDMAKRAQVYRRAYHSRYRGKLADTDGFTG